MKLKKVDGLFGFVLPSFFLAFLVLCAPLHAATENGAESTLQDVLESPAKQNKTSIHTLQLGLARAGNRLVSVGERGVILFSEDEGNSWTQAKSVPVSVTLTAVTFSDPLNGWAAGHSGVILATTDGGNTWQIQLDGFKAAELAMAEAESLIAAGDERGERAKRNAGYLIKEGADKPILDVYFANPADGWAIGAYGLAFATNDGGENWYSIIARLPNPAGKHLYKVVRSANELIILGEQAAVFSSADNGQVFESLDTPYYGSFFDGLLLEDGTRLLYGLRGNVWRQKKGKGRWKRIKLGSEVTLTSGLVSKDGQILLADQSGQLFVSSDAAKTFSLMGQAPFGGITDIIEANNGYAVSTARGAHVVSDNNLVSGGAR
ncbi:WD40/YVTN/BNR-like repeat-containing protein [Alteromonas lipolytica]|uniref:Photosynthesis system II assembly factor Ycf48/Hcf136-like domain-containing protein n=1 Tax=Alteromonas lipolytica TaxID=1856405 RepID=A0A1E8FE19_9ALTE|nr:YCF48-related protein [Alteromonas lipolytica]OFI34006.1 hypothetical protein BFC17_20865 [Alteromonas lipolytica]GGF66258.1 hypothetical protein GCM10011338_18250 [Alteromonas lipolytica]